MKDISADIGVKKKTKSTNMKDFDPKNPEGKYSLDLSQNYNQIVL